MPETIGADDQDLTYQRTLLAILCLVASTGNLADIASPKTRPKALSDIATATGLDAAAVTNVAAIFTRGLDPTTGALLLNPDNSLTKEGQVSSSFYKIATYFQPLANCPYEPGHCPKTISEIAQLVNSQAVA